MPFVGRGGSVTPDVFVRTAGQDLTDPDSGTLTLTIKDPDGVVLDGFPITYPSAGFVRLSLGHFAYTWQTASDQSEGTYAWLWNAELNGAAVPTATEEVELLPSGSISPETRVTTAAQVRALVTNGLSDDDLNAVIAREESLLAADVGALSGSRVETFVVNTRTSASPIRLRRRANPASLSVTQNNVAATDIRLLPDGRTVELLTSVGWAPSVWQGAVEATYIPDDTDRIVSWVIELVRARLTETGFESETAGTYSYDRGRRAERTHEIVMAEAIADIAGRSAAGRSIQSVQMTTDPTPLAWVGSARP